MRSELVLRPIYPESFIAKCATEWKMMILSVVLSIGFTVNRDDTENSIGAHRTNERRDGTSEKGRNCEM